MPQAIAMQLPVTAAVMPTATATPASTVGANGKAPVFAGWLLQFGRNAPASTPALADRTIGKDASPPANVAQQSIQPEPPASRATATDQGPLPLEPTLPGPAPTEPAPVSTPPVRPRLTVAVHPRSTQDLTTAASPAAAQDVVAAATAPSTSIPAMPPPATAPDTPRQSSADGRIKESKAGCRRSEARSGALRSGSE